MYSKGVVQYAHMRLVQYVLITCAISKQYVRMRLAYSMLACDWYSMCACDLQRCQLALKEENRAHAISGVGRRGLPIAAWLIVMSWSRFLVIPQPVQNSFLTALLVLLCTRPQWTRSSPHHVDKESSSAYDHKASNQGSRPFTFRLSLAPSHHHSWATMRFELESLDYASGLNPIPSRRLSLRR